MNNNFKYEVKANLGKIEKGIELRKIAWNGNPVKYDVRKWYTSYNGEERCGKGVSFGDAEVAGIIGVLDKKSGTVPMGKTEIRLELNKYGYDLGIWSNNYRLKGTTFTAEGIDRLKALLSGELKSVVKAPNKSAVAKSAKIIDMPKQAQSPKQKETPAAEKKAAPTIAAVKELTEHEKTVHALTSIPVNDGNYPINTATAEELSEAITIMESSPDGNRTRLARCKAKLNSLINNRKKPVTKPTPVTVTKQDDKKEEPVITYSSAEEKLRASLSKYKDSDSEYVINGVIEACAVDAEFAAKVMSPDKTYDKAFNYLYNLAKSGKCIMINRNCGMMDKDTALKYVLEYFAK